MELLLIAALGLGAYLYFKSQSAMPKTQDIKVDAIQLLDFTPYNMRRGPLTVLYIGPKGFTPQIVAGEMSKKGFGIMSLPVLRKTNVPIPGPSIVPAFADLWEVKGNYTGVEADNVTPDLLLKEVTGGVSIPGMPANRQLAALLYQSAMFPTTDTANKLIPIAAVSLVTSPSISGVSRWGSNGGTNQCAGTNQCGPNKCASTGARIEGYHRYSSRYWPRY